MSRTAPLLVAALAAAPLLVAAPADASAIRCRGTEVRRCVNVVWDRTNDTYYAKAWVVDRDGSPNYSVKVTNLRLRTYDGTYHLQRRAADDDGWFAVRDDARTRAVDPCISRDTFYATADFAWRGAGAGTQTVTSIGTGHTCG